MGNHAVTSAGRPIAGFCGGSFRQKSDAYAKHGGPFNADTNPLVFEATH